MTTPGRDSLNTFGGTAGAGYRNFAPVVDATVDLPAAGLNQALTDVAMMTRTAPRAVVQFQPLGTGTPALSTWWALWGNAPGNAPVVARSALGAFTLTFPATVQDDITVTSADGYIGPQTLNLFASFAQCGGSSYFACTSQASGNTCNVWTFGTSNTAVDPNGPVITVVVY